MEVIPLVMHTIRREMRSLRGPDLSVPQLRTLIFLRRNPNSSLSALAEHFGLGLSAVSRMIQILVERNLVMREVSATDRRSVTLALSARGKSTLESARNGTQAKLTEKLKSLSKRDEKSVLQALHILRDLFSLDQNAT